MAPAKKPAPPALDRPVARKLDGGLRQVLSMPEADLRTGLLEEHARVRRLRRRVGPLLAAPPSGLDVAALRRQLTPHPVWGAIRFGGGRLKPVRVRAITRFNGNRDDLAALGITVHGQAHDVFTIEATRPQLLALAQQPATAEMRMPRYLLPEVEQASAQAGIADVHQPRPANPTGYRGAGVIVGIVDSPLDVRHPTFRDAAAPHDSRVLYYWVQEPDSAAAPGQTPQAFNTTVFNGLNYGRLYTGADINAALGNAAGTYGDGNNQISQRPSTTDSEHGTHVAGIAAGNGHDANYTVGPHVGAAPDASIIHVTNVSTWANFANGGYEDRLIDAIDFIFRAAALEGMPVVVNVSQGTSLGPHDGRSTFDQARDNLLNSFDNRSIVWAAGNDNNDTGYATGTVNAGATASHMFTSTWPAASPFVTNNFLDVWYTGPELDIEVRRGAATSGWTTAGNEFHGMIGANQVDIDRDPEPSSGTRGVRIYIRSTDNSQTWTINLRNPSASDTATYWAWTGIQGQHATISGASQGELTLSDTGCGQAILTVGSSGKVVPPNVASSEAISGYSGAGPTVNDRVKPELVAVGGIGGAPVMSADSLALNGWVGMTGTSMAAPLVAGLVALILEERLNAGLPIDQDTVKALLIEYADRTGLNLDPASAGFVPTERNLWGYGRVRAIGPIDHHLPPQDVEVWVRTAPDDYGHEPFLGDVYWVAPEIRIRPTGSTTETNELHWGQTYDVTVTVRNLGDDAAIGTDVWLKYTRPFAAPNAWTPAEDTSDVALHTTVDVPALGDADAHFVWRPDSGEVPPPYPDAHFCVLAEVSHVNDVLTHPAPTTAGGTAWDSNIRGTNNVALRNVSIQ
jgi:subtilisin family serine protease